MTLLEAYLETKRRLESAGIASPAFDAACIFEKHAGVRRSDLPLCGGRRADFDLEAMRRDADRRAAGEPLQYILGEWEFMGLRFYVGPGVLVPRPDTELLCTTAMDYLKGRPNPRLLELCAGSGCVAISAVKKTPGSTAVCLERSEEAAAYLRRNIALHGLERRVEAVPGDMLVFDGAQWPSGGFDALVCNPPYIPTDDIGSLPVEVLHEPRMALDGGADGLRFYRAALQWLPVLRAGGLAAFEVGAGQAHRVAEILSVKLGGIFILRDCGGIERVVAGYLGGA